MISPSEIKLKAERKYKTYLQSIISKEDIFPLFIIGNKKPSNSIPKFKKELNNLISFSKEKKGFGYSINFIERKNKILGTQSFPDKILFESELDYQEYLKIEKEILLFKKQYQITLKEFSVLQTWVEKYPNKIIENINKWDDILKVCNYFKNNPKPNLYLRELPISVHTKFIENNASILQELLNIIIELSINHTETKFEKRFNLKYSDPLIRFKILDINICKKHFSGLSDISIPVQQFNKLNLPIEKVIIVENRTNLHTVALTFPMEEKTIVIFGSGFKVENLKSAEWLKSTEIIYWGDLDVQGFEILSQTRGYFEQTKSLLMDEETFEKYFENDNGTLSKVKSLLNLTNKETSIYEKIKKNNWRLEQEKIPLEYVKMKVKSQR
jgi:hypothetical protein